MLKLKIGLIVFAIFLLAYFLRVVYLPQKALTFGYDQARDAISAQSILGGHLKIQGPPASTPGLNHGVFYYYLLAPAYAFGKNPVNAAYLVALINSLTVFIVFGLGYLMSKKIKAGILSAVLFAFSFEATQYATWLSNPTVAVLTVPLMYLGLWLWIEKKNKWAPLITALGLGLSIQSEIFLTYHIVPMLIWLWVSRKNITRKQIIVFLLTLSLSLSSMIVSEVKFGFRGIEGIKNLLAVNQPNLAYATSIGDFLNLYLNQIGRIFAFNSYPGNIFYGGVFIIALAVYYIFRKDKTGLFISTWLFSHVAVVSLGGTSTPFLMVGIGPAVSLILGIALNSWFSSGKKFIAAFVSAILISGNLAMITRENYKGSTIFSIQKEMTLKRELAAIDYTYKEAAGKKFSINSLTSPLYINIVWSYLYKWYGVKTYGYAPQWSGRDQVGQLDSLAQTSADTKLMFLIIEPMDGIPSQYLDETIHEADAKSVLVKEQYFGQIRVQERLKK